MSLVIILLLPVTSTLLGVHSVRCGGRTVSTVGFGGVERWPVGSNEMQGAVQQELSLNPVVDCG